MNIEDIKSLPVEKIAGDDSILFLWITFPCLLEGISVMESWGFTYKTCGFNWVKRNKKADTFFMGLGFWTRSNSEICILGTRGRPKKGIKSCSAGVRCKDYGTQQEARRDTGADCGAVRGSSTDRAVRKAEIRRMGLSWGRDRRQGHQGSDIGGIGNECRHKNIKAV